MKNGNIKINISKSRLPVNQRARYHAIRAKAVNALGGVCCKCGFDNPIALQIDHINGGGCKERENFKGSAFLYHVLNNPDKTVYQILCANCNWIKRWENQECARKYADDHVFPREEPSKAIFKPKECKNCKNQFTPLNGRQIYCNKPCKGLIIP